MSNIMTTQNMPITMTSREIAELTGKRHDHVLRDVENMLAELGETSPQFWGDLPDSYGRLQRVAFLPKDLTITLVAGYNVKMRHAIVKRWQELEAQQAPAFVIPQTMSEALRLAAEAIEQRDQLALENAAKAQALAEAEPKVKGFDLITAGEKSITMRECAKLLGVKESVLTAWLHEHGWTYRLNGRWVAKQPHIQAGRLIYKEARYTDQHTGQEVYAPYCHITPKGLAKLASVFGVDPLGLAA